MMKKAKVDLSPKRHTAWGHISRKRRLDAVIPRQDLERAMERLKPFLSFYRKYPDKFIDFISDDDCPITLYFYQRMFLRINARYQYVYGTFNRAFGKSFLSILSLYLKCIFYPGVKVFISAPGKEQATKIARSKIDEIWEWWPVLRMEVQREEKTRDYIKLYFKNGSQLDIMPAQESTRGQRRHSGLLEEVIMMDGEKLNRFVIPTLNIDRMAKNGKVDPNEIHKQQIYVTTAGYKNTFAYEKLIQLLIWMIVRGNAFVWGGDYRIPVLYGLLNENFVEELKDDGTFNIMDFSREYESQWSGVGHDVFFSAEDFDKQRVLKIPHYEAEREGPANSFYVLGVDVGRLSAQTVIQVLKVIPTKTAYMKSLVNTIVLESTHFETQAIEIKKAIERYNAQQVIVDATGLGVGLIDFLVINGIDPITKVEYPSLGISNDPTGIYDKYDDGSREKLLYIIKANDELNNQLYVNCLSQFGSNKVKLLIDDKLARTQLLSTKEGRALSPQEKARRLRPFVYTSILKEEMMNLRQNNVGNKLKLEQVSRTVGKDKFSAFLYALWYVKLIEEQNLTRRKKIQMSDFMMFN